jgi:simple sugar transport system permease protein
MTNNPYVWTSFRKRAISFASTNRTQLAVWPAIVILVIVGGIVNSSFLTQRNLINVLQQASVLAVLTLAMLLVILVRKFDLSIESTVAFAPMLAALVIMESPTGWSTSNLSGWIGFGISLAVGGFIGLVNGLLVVKLKLNAFITTLAMLILVRGATLGISEGKTIVSPPAEMIWPGNGNVFGIPTAVVVAIVLYISVGIFLRYNQIGRNLYAIGGNPLAARAAGIRVDQTIIGVFVTAGLLAGLSGLMLSGRIDSVVAQQGTGYIFDVFAALAIGAVSLNGGRGTVLGALSGVLFLSILANILVLAGVPSFWVDMSRGAIIVLALILSRFTRGRDMEED